MSGLPSDGGEPWAPDRLAVCSDEVQGPAPRSFAISPYHVDVTSQTPPDTDSFNIMTR